VSRKNFAKVHKKSRGERKEGDMERGEGGSETGKTRKSHTFTSPELRHKKNTQDWGDFGGADEKGYGNAL